MYCSLLAELKQSEYLVGTYCSLYFDQHYYRGGCIAINYHKTEITKHKAVNGKIKKYN